MAVAIDPSFAEAAAVTAANVDRAGVRGAAGAVAETKLVSAGGTAGGDVEKVAKSRKVSPVVGRNSSDAEVMSAVSSSAAPTGAALDGVVL